jgi:AhpD family alkylhydroperoxidase
MTTRVNPYTTPNELIKPFIEFAGLVANAGLEHTIIELVKIRASQINGCAVCLTMHTRDARKAGETEERIFMLDAWRESALYTERERAALAWTEALTKLHETRAPDADYAAVQAQFTAEEQVKLTMMIGVINTFNKLGVGFRVAVPGTAKAA